MGSGNAIHLAREQLPGARQQPGFTGFYLLTDTETGTIMTILLWETRDQMEAGRGTGCPVSPKPANVRPRLRVIL
jgi:heme-degrading monooxygenase HmoA